MYLYINTAAKFKENITWPVKTDDFMPLANDAHSYWTGFFTSRYTHIHTHTHTHTNTHKHSHAYIHTRTHTHKHV